MILVYDTHQLGPTLFLSVTILHPSQAWTSIPLASKASDILLDARLANVGEHGEYKRFEEVRGEHWHSRNASNCGKSMYLERRPAMHHSRFIRTAGDMNSIGNCK